MLLCEALIVLAAYIICVRGCATAALNSVAESFNIELSNRIFMMKSRILASINSFKLDSLSRIDTVDLTKFTFIGDNYYYRNDLIHYIYHCQQLNTCSATYMDDLDEMLTEYPKLPSSYKFKISIANKL